MSKDQNHSDKACDDYFDNPYAATSGSYYSDRVTFYAGFAAGVASRAEQIASLKDELRQISTAIDDVRLDLTNTAAELIMEMKEQLASRDAEVAELVAALEQCNRYAKATLPTGYLALFTGQALAKVRKP